MKAAEIMTEDPMTIAPTDTIRDAADVLRTVDVRHLPVVDSEGRLVGMLSDRDLGTLGLWSAETEPDELESTLSQPVTKVMTGDPITVDRETEVTEIIDTLLDGKIGAVPVIDGEGSQQLLGIVSYVDVLREIKREVDEGELPNP